MEDDSVDEYIANLSDEEFLELFPDLTLEDKIFIKPENRGKFTATKKRTGKTTAQLRKSKNPITRKRAVFAANAKKWNHKGKK